MLNKREFLKIGLSSLLPSFLIKPLLGSTLELPNNVPEYFRYPILSNGIDKIFKFHKIEESQKDLTLLVENNDFLRIPISRTDDFSTINDDCWHNILATANYNTSESTNGLKKFHEEKCTDIFIDEDAIQPWIGHPGINIHKINLSKYYDFYINSLQGRFAKHKDKLFISCDLSTKNAIIPINNTSYGVCILDSSKFMLGQQY